MDGVCEVSCLGDSYDGGSVMEGDSFGEKKLFLCAAVSESVLPAITQENINTCVCWGGLEPSNC